MRAAIRSFSPEPWPATRLPVSAWPRGDPRPFESQRRAPPSRYAVCRRGGTSKRWSVPRAWRGAGSREGFAIRSRTPEDEHQLKHRLAQAERDLARAATELERLRERLAAEIAEREELVTVVTHELRTPLTVLAGFTKLLLSERVGPLTPEQRRFLEESGRSCRRLDSFIESWTDAARHLAHDAPLELGDHSLEAAVRTLAEFFAPILEERGIRIDLALEAAAARARFDPMRIEQVLTNLIGNASRFASKGGRIEVATRLRTEAGAERVEVAVSDDGPGVPPDQRERIFRPWVRGTGTDERGLGLGLAICARIVAAHGGTIAVGDAPGGGSRFAFTLLAPQRRPQGRGEGR